MGNEIPRFLHPVRSIPYKKTIKTIFSMEQIPLKLEKSDIAIIADDVVKEKLTFSINLIANIGNFFRTAAPEVKIRVVGSFFQKIWNLTEKSIESDN